MAGASSDELPVGESMVADVGAAAAMSEGELPLVVVSEGNSELGAAGRGAAPDAGNVVFVDATGEAEPHPRPTWDSTLAGLNWVSNAVPITVWYAPVRAYESEQVWCVPGATYEHVKWVIKNKMGCGPQHLRIHSISGPEQKARHEMVDTTFLTTWEGQELGSVQVCLSSVPQSRGRGYTAMPHAIADVDM